MPNETSEQLQPVADGFLPNRKSTCHRMLVVLDHYRLITKGQRGACRSRYRLEWRVHSRRDRYRQAVCSRAAPSPWRV